MRSALLLALAVLAGACDPPRVRRAWSPREEGPLATASELRGQLRGTAGAARERARARAAAAYETAAGDPGLAADVRAEAAFRAAELLRAGGDGTAAAALFERCRALAPAGPFGGRALLELGHVHRRAGRADAALAAYGRLVADARVDPPLRDRAALWAGRVEADRGDDAAARRAWERLARGAGDPLLRLEAFDRWAASLTRAGRLEEAAGVLELGRAALRPRAAERSELGRRLRAGLEELRSPELLAAAVAARWKRRADPPATRPPARRPPPRRSRAKAPPPPPY